MELTERMDGPVRIVTATGRIDQASANDFQQQLQPWLDACKQATAPLLLDFAGVDYISSVGLRVLMLAAKQVKGQQGKIAIAALTPVVEEVFQISRFNLVFKVYPDCASAIVGLS